MSRRRVEQLVQIRDQHLAAVALASCEAADARARGDWVLRPPREPPSKAVVQAAENEVVDAQQLSAFRDEKVAEAKEQMRSADVELQKNKELRQDAARRESRAGKALTPSKPWHAPLRAAVPPRKASVPRTSRRGASSPWSCVDTSGASRLRSTE